MILRANALQIPLADKSVHCVITSPPYWGLRDYGVNSQLGLEKTPEEYIAKMLQVFREVWRVLRDDGTLWLNLGDSYARDPKKGGSGPNGKHDFIPDYGKARSIMAVGSPGRAFAPQGEGEEGTLKAKDLVGIPWRVAFALQADGWYLRSDIIWAKPNPMPESVTDRPTKAHEYIFLLTKSPKYFFDQEAAREPQSPHTLEAFKNGIKPITPKFINNPEDFKAGQTKQAMASVIRNAVVPGGRNIRTVWTIATQPFPEVHFATFPEKLVEPCLKAGTSERGCCPKCGGPWVRIVEKGVGPQEEVGTLMKMILGRDKANMSRKTTLEDEKKQKGVIPMKSKPSAGNPPASARLGSLSPARSWTHSPVVAQSELSARNSTDGLSDWN